MEGQVIAGRYVIGERLGAGGMGIVYHGRDNITGEAVAIKHLKPEIIAGDPLLMTRFEREGEILRQLHHPNIVRILVTVQVGDTHYLIMELVEGGSLDDLLRAGSLLPLNQSLKIALELADALTRAHHLNVIHRDIKPANVLIATDGTPRLTDFGVAHIDSAQPVTESGVAVGTLDYLSPEALQGDIVDARADIWAFGVLLFELLAGQRPFTGTSLTATMLAIMQQPVPDLEALCPDCPVALVDLVYRMLTKDRNQRIASMRLVGAQLEAILQGNSLEQSAPRTVQLQPGVFDTPVNNAGAKGHNLPQQSTPFVGREAELERLQHHLDDSQTRLITILGPGGMGKTRLSLELAERSLQRIVTASQASGYFPLEAYLVELAPLTSPDQIVAATAEAIGLRFSPGSEPQEQLLQYLREKRLLLVLDNFEHLLAGAELVSAILKTAAQVKIIITSRERLNLQGELLFNITGMDIPDQTTPTDALNYGSIHLFVQSAKRVQPDFELDTANLPAVLQIVRLVQGMPLGIILAASWLEMLTPAEIAAEIGKSLDFLETELRDLPTRQRSIRAVFEYSWNLLTDAERDVFMKLTVFRGGFTREAAQAVTGASLRILMALVNKSLIRRDTITGRYEIHELLRQYAEEQLVQSGDMKAVQNAHGAYFAPFIEQNGKDLKGAHVVAAVDTLEEEIENLHVAVNWIVAQHNLPAFEQIMDALWLLYELRSWHHEGVILFGRAVNIGSLESSNDAVEIIRAHALGRQAWFLAQTFAPDRARTVAEQSIATLERFNRKDGLIVPLISLTASLNSLQQFSQLMDAANKGLVIARENGDLFWVGICLFVRGWGEVGQGNLENARETVQASISSFEAAGSKVFSGLLPAIFLGELDYYLGHYTEARVHFNRAFQAIEVLEYPLAAQNLHTRMGWLARAEKNYPEARKHFRQKLLHARRMGHIQEMLWSIFDFATLRQLEGDKTGAIHLFVLVSHHPLSNELHQAQAKKELANLEAEFDPDVYKATWEYGKKLTLDQGLTELL